MKVGGNGIWIPLGEIIKQGNFRGALKEAVVRLLLKIPFLYPTVLANYYPVYNLSKGTSSLYVAFMDLKAAFDSFSQAKLWDKLESSSIDKRFSFLIRSLHAHTSLRVKCNNACDFIDPINILKGIRQGYLPVTLLFIFYINDIVSYFIVTDYHPPILAHCHI